MSPRRLSESQRQRFTTIFLESDSEHFYTRPKHSEECSKSYKSWLSRGHARLDKFSDWIAGAHYIKQFPTRAHSVSHHFDILNSVRVAFCNYCHWNAQYDVKIIASKQALKRKGQRKSDFVPRRDVLIVRPRKLWRCWNGIMWDVFQITTKHSD